MGVVLYSAVQSNAIHYIAVECSAMQRGAVQLCTVMQQN